MGNSKPRVDVPKNVVDELDLADRIYAKHLADGDKSVLKSLQYHSWDENGPQVATAKSLHQQAEDLQRQANLAYRQRDLLCGEIDNSVKATRDLLLGIYRDNPKELSQWGFDVSDSPKAAAKKQA